MLTIEIKLTIVNFRLSIHQLALYTITTFGNGTIENVYLISSQSTLKLCYVLILTFKNVLMDKQQNQKLYMMNHTVLMIFMGQSSCIL